MTLLAVIAVGLGSAAQAMTGFGLSLVSAPFLVAAYRAPEGVQLNLVLSMVLNLLLLGREHRHADRAAAARLLVPALIVTLPAAYVVRHIAAGPLTVAAGLVCGAGVMAVAGGWRFTFLTGGWGTATTGALSGAMNVVSGLSGPAVVLFAINAGWRPSRSRPTLQLFFLGLNIAALAALGYPDHFPLGLPAALAAGTLAGGLLAGRPSDLAVRRLTLLLAAAGSVLAVARGLTASG